MARVVPDGVLQGMTEMSDAVERSDLGAWIRRQRIIDSPGRTDGWDGEWYLRANFDDGTPLGSSATGEGRQSILCPNPGPGSAAAGRRIART